MPTASVQAQRFKVLLAGVFSQILCIGIARFAYTPLLPVMQQQMPMAMGLVMRMHLLVVCQDPTVTMMIPN